MKIMTFFLLTIFATMSIANNCPTESVINDNLKSLPNGLLYVSFPGEDGIWIGSGEDTFGLRNNSKIQSFKRAHLTNNKSMVHCDYVASMENGQYTKEVKVFLASVANFRGMTSTWVANGEVCEQKTVAECAFEKIK